MPTARASKQIFKFVSATHARCLNMGSILGEDVVLPCSILGFGVGLDVECRLAAHSSYEGSSYIMNLFHVCCEYLSPGEFTLHQFVVLSLDCRPLYSRKYANIVSMCTTA
jgi:hypothetical protein